MFTRLRPALALALFGVVALLGTAYGKDVDVEPMYGGLLIDGYAFDADSHPQGSIRYDAEKNEFRGHYTALKMPAGRRAVFAWLHDTTNQKTTYLGVVGWLMTDTGGTKEADFTVAVPSQFKGGKFGSNEIIGFTAETTSAIAADGTVTKRPTAPSGSQMQPLLKPAFYLFAKLPGASTDRAFCGHGKDFFYAKAPDKQTCYDCLCGQKYTLCRAAGLSLH